LINKRKFVDAVLEIEPSFGFVEGYFYIKPVKDIMVGFCCDFGRHGRAYFLRYAHPLYDNIEHFNLLYGERLPKPDDTLLMDTHTDMSLAAEFCRRIAAWHPVMLELSDLTKFKALAETRNLANPWARRALALTLIMLGRKSEAESHLNILSSLSLIDRYRGFRDDINSVRGALSLGLDQGVALLCRWEEEAKRKFNLV
jgi:hypothetical protein